MISLKYSLIIVMQFLQYMDGYKILAYFPIPSYSHSEIQKKLVTELLNRGHEITLISAFPSVESRNNCRIINISPVYEKYESSADIMAWEKATPTEVVFSWNEVVEAMCEGHANLPAFQEFIRSGEKFDMLIMEEGFCLLSTLIFVTGNPIVVQLIPYEPFPFHLQTVGNVFHPGYAVVNMLPYTDHMTLFQRLVNCYTYIMIYYYYNFEKIEIEKLFQDRFSKMKLSAETPRVSLLITHDHWSVTYPVGLLPSVIESRGLIIDPYEKPPTKEITTFMDEATEGLIYLSLGTHVNSSVIPEDKVYAILETFSRLPFRVIWKWDTDPLTDLPRNVIQLKWAPQQAILAHRNTRLFITQGGMQSLQQAIYYEVPLIVIPFLSEQKYNGRKVQDSEIGEVLGLRKLTRGTLLDTITKIFNNYERFKENLARCSTVFRDHPMPPLEKTVWWLEYYLRHKGATHLQSVALDLRWSEYLMLDVLAFVSVTTTALFFLLNQAVSCVKAVLLRRRKQ